MIKFINNKPTRIAPSTLKRTSTHTKYSIYTLHSAAHKLIGETSKLREEDYIEDDGDEMNEST